jgi:hypothetical protein
VWAFHIRGINLLNLKRSPTHARCRARLALCGIQHFVLNLPKMGPFLKCKRERSHGLGVVMGLFELYSTIRRLMNLGGSQIPVAKLHLKIQFCVICADLTRVRFAKEELF